MGRGKFGYLVKDWERGLSNIWEGRDLRLSNVLGIYCIININININLFFGTGFYQNTMKKNNRVELLKG